MQIGLVRHSGDGTFQQPARRIQIAAGGGNEAGKMQRIGIIWRDGQDLRINPLGFRELPGALKLKSRIKPSR
jgi:hypothetical protein